MAEDGVGTTGVGEGRLSVAVRGAPGSRVLVLHGELDHDTADVLREALDGCLAAAPARILLDFADLRFCDSTGLNVLLRARLAARESGREVELCGLGPQVARLFEITGAGGVFRVHPSVAQALSSDG
ncbi:STAS domain-containing protein [Kitasatospora sp. NPDC052896]|uniref:STAS domain-containing protein n=1 Tax=Kitasatospora sp. NPDC052896 TaxID=3364061 RepID=UPI0037CC3253